MWKNLHLFIFLLATTLSQNVLSLIYYPAGDVSSLIDNIEAANGTAGYDIVDLGGFVYTFDGSIPLYLNDDGAFSALPMIAADGGRLSIINGVIQRSFSASDEFRIIYNNGDLDINNITLVNGSVTNYGGGGIYNAATLAISNCTITKNSAHLGDDTESGNGGGIYNYYGTIDAIIDSTISNNVASGHGGGGGILNFGGVVGTILNSTISGNTVTSDGGGGGINNVLGTISDIINTTISRNSASAGGGIVHLEGHINTISNSTIYGNIATTGAGGGIYSLFSTINAINNNTISGNSAPSEADGKGGGICNFGTISLLVSNIVAANTAGTSGPDIYNADTISSEGYNLLSTADDSSLTNGINNDIVQSDANLYFGQLQDNGGPTFTIAPLPGSLAINNGNNSPRDLLFDQRGQLYRRVICAAPDIGAFERQYCSL